MRMSAFILIFYSIQFIIIYDINNKCSNLTIITMFKLDLIQIYVTALELRGA